MIPEPAKESENETESVELQMDIVCLNDNECVNKKVLEKDAPLRSNPVKMLDSVIVFDCVNAFKNVLDSENVFDSGNVFDS